MDYPFLWTSFVVGVLAASGIGPIFILTFNKGALHGFSRGFAVACGAAVVDGIFFFLALVGVLAAIKDSSRFLFMLDFVGECSTKVITRWLLTLDTKKIYFSHFLMPFF